jgi:hypothetical protein
MSPSENVGGALAPSFGVVAVENETTVSQSLEQDEATTYTFMGESNVAASPLPYKLGLIISSAAAAAALEVWTGPLGTAVKENMEKEDLSLTNLLEGAAAATSYGVMQTPVLQPTINGKLYTFITKREQGWCIMRKQIRRSLRAHAEAAVAAMMSEATFDLRFKQKGGATLLALQLGLLQTCSLEYTVPLGSAPIELVQSKSSKSSSGEPGTDSSAFQGELCPGRRVLSSSLKAWLKHLTTLAWVLADSSGKQA